MEVLLQLAGMALLMRRFSHAIDNALVVEDAGDEPDRWLVIGPDRAGNLLEIVVLVPEGREFLVIHAMNMRVQFRRLLP